MAEPFDVAVVGGGIIGCASAYELARAGARVALIERSELAAGASGRNHGLLVAPLDPALGPMAAASTSLYEEVVPQAPLPVHLDSDPIGFLIVAGSEPERDAARTEAEAAASCGVGTARIEARDLPQLEPELRSDLAEAWLLHDGRRLDPAALTVALGLLAQELGARLHRNLTARAVIDDPGGRRVRGVATDAGILEARTVVLAAGPWSAQLLRPHGIHLPVVGARGWLVHVDARPGLVRHVVGRAGWHAAPGREGLEPARVADLAGGRIGAFVSSLIHPNPDGTLLLGGSRQHAVRNEPEDEEVPREIVRQAMHLFPGLADANVLSAWWGVRPMTPDGRPIVGFVRPGLLVATGHGSQGVILGGGTARLVAAMVAGAPEPFHAGGVAPERFARNMAR